MAETLRKLMFLMGAYYFLQAIGGNPGFHNQALQKYLKETLDLGPAGAAAFMAFLLIPWMIKPFYGILSDFLPIFGSRRKNYFIVAGFLGTLSYGALSFFGASRGTLSLFLFTAAVALAFSDVLCDAVMVEKGQPLNATDRLQAIQWTLLGIAGIIIAFSKGYIATYFPLEKAVLLSMAAPAVMILVTILLLKEERVVSSFEGGRRAWSGIKSAARSKPLWGAAIFLFLFQLNPNLGAVLYYYEKDVLKFSDIQIGHIDTVGAIAFVVGTMFFGAVSKQLSQRELLRAIIISGVIANVSYLFFRDVASAFFVMGVSSMVGVLAFLGILTIAAKICPKYAEGTIFALLMSITNAGAQLGEITGGKLYEVIGYSWLVVISAVFTAAMWFFLPLVRSREDDSKPRLNGHFANGQ